MWGLRSSMLWTRPPLCGLLAATLASVAAVPNPAARAPLAAELSDGDFKCSVKSDAADSDIGDALSWLCGSGEIDCAEINPGGAHFQPNTNRDHGDWAFDQYYQKHSSNGFSTCYFGGLAAVLPAPLGHFEFLSGGQLLYPTFAKAGMQATDKIPPLGSMTFLSTPFSGNWTGQDSIFSVLVGAASSGVEAHAEVSYDSNGDGIAERTEIYLGAPDGLSVIPEFQPYTNAMGVESFTGDFGEMKNGKINLTIVNLSPSASVYVEYATNEGPSYFTSPFHLGSAYIPPTPPPPTPPPSDCTTWYESTKRPVLPYGRFRSVTRYGAKGDGSHGTSPPLSLSAVEGPVFGRQLKDD